MSKEEVFLLTKISDTRYLEYDPHSKGRPRFITVKEARILQNLLSRLQKEEAENAESSN